MKKIICSALFLGALSLTSCGEYQALQKSQDYEYRYEASKAYFVEGKYKKAATLLGDLIAMLKGTVWGEESLYMLSMSEYQAKNYETAGNYFKKYYQTYPKGTYVEQAYYYSGMSLFNQTPEPRLDQTTTLNALSEIQNFLDLYPTTSMKHACQEMIFALQDKLVDKECLSAQLYYNLGSYVGNCTSGGSNYQACVVTAQNALRDYPYAAQYKRERLSFLVLSSKYKLAIESVEEKRIERFRDAIDEYYAFINDFPESKYSREAKDMFDKAERIVKNKNINLDEDEE
ncbi:MAG: outer membrane protein assembly factor BamD [Prevotellaceae bacterium]|nr:outer membrane protein assembly factor BamD [Prevotellaceae bacterium]